MTPAFAPPRLSAGDFGAALMDPDGGTPDGAVGPDGRPDARRFNVYRNNVIVSLSEALGATYPAIKKLLGEEYFAALARAFIVGHPPENPVLIWYGEAFGGFLEVFPPLSAYPYLADVARLEWAWLQAYHAADIKVLDPAQLGGVAPEKLGDLRFLQHPSTAVVTSRWPVWDLVQANRFGGAAPDHIDLSIAQSVLVTRPELDVEMRLLDAGASGFAAGLLEGATLGEAAEAAQRAFADFSLSECLTECLSSGAFAGLQQSD